MNQLKIKKICCYGFYITFPYLTDLLLKILKIVEKILILLNSQKLGTSELTVSVNLQVEHYPWPITR